MFVRDVRRSGYALCACALAACSGGGGGGTAGTTGFLLEELSVPDGAVWQINREIVFRFNEAIDFHSVSSNTIQIRSSLAVPAVGVFRLRDESTVVFQPACPTLADLSDAGLTPGGVSYTVRVVGIDTSPNTVRSMRGVSLGVQVTRTFSTPLSSQPFVAFQDVVSGPPRPVVREPGSSETEASYLELGGDPDQRVYFEREPGHELTLSIPGFRSPLNLYSDPAARIAILIAFDQSVGTAEVNFSNERLGLEFSRPDGGWSVLDARITLEKNCTETGAFVRLEPLGVLPPESELRAVVRPGFQDLVGDSVQQELVGFAEVPTRVVEFTSLAPADELSDAFHERFDFGGTSPLSYEDSTALFDTPVAEWGGGTLSAAFDFDGTGGPNGDFDWFVHSGELFFFDTVSTPIVGGPGGFPTATLESANGIVDVHNLVIEEGGEIRVQGPNPMRIFASGDVIIRGRLDISGFNAKDVATLNTGAQEEIGGAGIAGGGKGGNANENTSGPTPRGGRGSGPFRQANLGGEGGEMGVNPGAKNLRRPGGGGGGTLGRSAAGTQTFSPNASMASSAGTNGNPASVGAVSGRSPAAGGLPGQGPFVDASDANDFFGVRPLLDDGTLVGLVRGELPSLWAGYGGGAGGNAGEVFPNPAWGQGSDEKGGGGGGGAGGLHVKALGRIVFGAGGQIIANGGRGATGENVITLDHIGGTGGSGSGGHVVLESATAVDFTDGGDALGAASRDWILAAGVPLRSGTLENVDPCCERQSNGGAGGPGLVQIHVPDTVSPPSSDEEADVRVPLSAAGAANPLDMVSSPPALRLIPTFSARSKARSRWIAIGGADQDPSGTPDLVRFLFDGLVTSGEDEGKIRASNGRVEELAPLVADDALAASSSARILEDGFTLELTGAALDALRAGTTSGLSNDVYLRTPALLTDCVVRLFVLSAPSNRRDFTIASARYDEGEPAAGDEALQVVVTAALGRLDEFNADEEHGTTALHLLPRFFRVVTNNIEGALPEGTFVRLRFQAVGANGAGAPDEAHPLTEPPWTGDLTLFNTLAPGALRFFRFEAEFDLDADASGLTRDTEPVRVDFLKLPFVF
jgi:hypothetical protein